MLDTATGKHPPHLLSFMSELFTDQLAYRATSCRNMQSSRLSGCHWPLSMSLQLHPASCKSWPCKDKALVHSNFARQLECTLATSSQLAPFCIAEPVERFPQARRVSYWMRCHSNQEPHFHNKVRDETCADYIPKVLINLVHCATKMLKSCSFSQGTLLQKIAFFAYDLHIQATVPS